MFPKPARQRRGGTAQALNEISLYVVPGAVPPIPARQRNYGAKQNPNSNYPCTQSRGSCMLNLRGRADAGPRKLYMCGAAKLWVGPCCGAAQNPKRNTFVRGHGAVHPKPMGPRSCGAAQNPKRNTIIRGPGGVHPKPAGLSSPKRACLVLGPIS